MKKPRFKRPVSCQSSPFSVDQGRKLREKPECGSNDLDHEGKVFHEECTGGCRVRFGLGLFGAGSTRRRQAVFHSLTTQGEFETRREPGQRSLQWLESCRATHGCGGASFPAHRCSWIQPRGDRGYTSRNPFTDRNNTRFMAGAKVTRRPSMARLD